MCFEYRSQALGCIAMALRCWFRYPLPYEELPFQCILSKDSQNDFETIWRCLIRTGSIDSCYCFTMSLATVGARPLQKPFPLLPSHAQKCLPLWQLGGTDLSGQCQTVRLLACKAADSWASQPWNW